MFNQLNTNLTDASSADFSLESSRALPAGDGSGSRAQFAAELNRSVITQNTAAESAGTVLPDSGNGLPSGQQALEFQQSIEADLAGVEPDVLQSIYSDLEELAEISGGSTLIIDDAITRHDKFFSAQAFSLDGAKGLISALPGEERIPGPVTAGAVGVQNALATTTATRFIQEQPTAGFQPPNVTGTAGQVQSTDRSLDRLERTLQAVASNTRLNEQTVRTVAQPIPLVDPALLDDKMVPKPAPIVNVDGNLTDAERYRFRPIGLTPGSEPTLDARLETSTTAARPLTTDSVSRFESIGVLSDGLRSDASLLNKPTTGGFQVHAPSTPQTALPNTATLQPGAGGLMLSDTVQTAVQDQSWGDRIGDRVAMMANNRLQNAELRLTPAELGPLRVKVSIEDGLANVSFVAQHAVTRDAIEQAMPRLREMLEQQGINLGQSSVDEQAADSAFADSDGGDGESHGSSDSRGDGDGRNPDQPAIASTRRVSTNLLDTFV